MENRKLPKIRFSNFDDAWILKSWADTVDISTNMVDPKTGEFDELPHVGPGNIESFTGRILNNVKSVKEDNLISGKFHFKSGDVIYGKINPQLAKYALPNFEGLASADSYVLNTKNDLTQRFLYMILQRKDFYRYSVSVSRRTGMPKINRDELNQYVFYVPKSNEQEKIGSFFKELDEIITHHQQELDTLKQTKQGFLQKMFPKEGETVPEVRFGGFDGQWVKQKLGDIGNVTKLAGFEFTNYVKYSDQGNIPTIRGLNVKNGRFIFQDVKYIDGSDFSKLQRSKLKAADIVFTYVGTVGEAAIVPENVEWYLAPNVSRIRTTKVNPDFLLQLLSHPNFKQREIVSRIATSSQPALSMENIRKFLIPTPSLEEQIKIGEFFRQLDQTIELHEKELEALKETKKAFLQKMFV